MKTALVTLAFLATTLTATAGGGWFIGPMLGARINGATGDGMDESSTTLGITGGANVLGCIGGNFWFDGGVMYTQRGVLLETPAISLPPFTEIPASQNTALFNYLDIVLGINWYILGDGGMFRPYAGVAVQPGFFMSGTTTTKIGDDEESQDVNSDEVESFHASVMPKIGADIALGSLLLGAAVGYDLGLTNVNATQGETASDLKYNGIVINVRLAIPLGGGSDEPEVDPMNVD